MSTHRFLRLPLGGCAVALLVTLVAWPADARSAPRDAPETEQPPPPPPQAEADGMPGLPPRPPPVRDGMGQPRPGMLLWDRMTEAERDRFREFLAEHFPDRFDELSELEANDPPQFRMFIGRILPEMRRLREMREKDPELFEVRKQEMETEVQLRRLARRYRFARDEARPELEKEIRTVVERHFDLRTEREAKELARLETRLAQLRKRSEARTNDRGELIEQIVADVLAGRPPRPGPRERLGGEDPGGSLPDEPAAEPPPRERVRRPQAGDGEGDRPPRERRPGRRRGAPTDSPKPPADEGTPAPSDNP